MPEQMEKAEPEESKYFSLQASWGITSHIGGLRATEKLARLCHIKPDDNVLVVGCGNGQTSVYLEQKHHCRITGIDISEEMVKLSRRRASKKGVSDKVVFQVEDAQRLTFNDNEFDAVICESVNSFVPDVQVAMKEYCRVVKPGKRVGMNEVTWLKPPTPRVTDYFIRSMGARPHDAIGWQDLMEAGGLEELTVQVFHPNMLTMWYDEMRQMGMSQALASWGSFFKMMIKNSPEVRKYIRDLWPPPWNILSYMGYGIYIGVKPTR
jgi:ubiquinone/menaquinone biosynthesis C-methylase UbiE